jgi:hypothetical protein
METRRIELDNPRDVRGFVHLPFEIYRHIPQWVPPLEGQAVRALDRQRHPYYRYSDAAFFMVEHNGQAMGRIGVMDNRLYNDYRQANTAFFGFFEVFEDDQAAQALFDAAFEWAHSRGWMKSSPARPGGCGRRRGPGGRF